MMRRIAILLACCAGICAFHAGAGWQAALPGWHFEFPRDHGSHPGFKTEWWYFTGNLHSADGWEYGYELTFFRQGVIPPGEGNGATSRFVTRDLKFAHFAVSDISGRHFYFAQRISRGAYGEAGFDGAGHLAWIGGWQVARSQDGAFSLHATDGSVELNLNLIPQKPPAIHGENGVSQKAAGEGHASQYYSISDLRSTGTMRTAGKDVAVSGESWFDHEWATNQLASNQAGWDWMGLHLDDGRDIMLYRMRGKDGLPDSASSGTLISRDGATRHLAFADFSMHPLKWWTSPSTGARYPVEWNVSIPSAKLDFTVNAAMENQELALSPVAYWEGAVRVSGNSLAGDGYLELVGYGGKLTGLSAPGN